jgi:tRNASer (uridine44-2'-O)-methyltransferase
LKNLIYYPELTIALILRAEIISKDDRLHWEDLVHNAMDQEEQIKGFISCETVHRKLIPKVPERDAPLRQDCILYRAEDGMDIQLVVFIPKMDPKQRMPHYHPDVKAIAFQYIPSTSDDTSILRIDIPLDDPSAALPSSRLFKTCVVLLDTISKHGWGLFNGYKKRVVHDTIVQKETYQDLYYVMKEKYKYLKDEWMESTDATKNVFEVSRRTIISYLVANLVLEDIGIATFLMLLWKDTYDSEDSEVWGRPPGGFIDMGSALFLAVTTRSPISDVDKDVVPGFSYIS